MLELAPGDASFASQVALFYRRRGYEVRENAKVRGASDRVYPLRLVASGPLGALVVSFGDAGGVDEMEVARIRGVAKDIGATPVLATPHAEAWLRRAAAQMAVVLLDAEALGEQAPPTQVQEIRKDLASHPWPDSGRPAADPWPSGTSRAVEVDDLLAGLAKPKPAPAPLLAPSAPLVDAAIAAPAGSAALAPTAPRASSWLDGLGEPVPGEPQAASALPLPAEPAAELVSEVLAPVPLPAVPAIEVDLPALGLRQADRAFLRLRWAKRLAWTGLGLAGLWLAARWLGA